MRRIPLDEDAFILSMSNDPHQIVTVLEDLFHVRRERYEPAKYCINIKVHCLPLTLQQKQKALANLVDIWDLFIFPWVNEFKTATGHEIFSEGRSGGYLYVDGASEVLESYEMIEAQNDDDEEPPRIEAWARERFEILAKFWNEWNMLMKEIKAWLNTRRLAKHEDYRWRFSR